MDFLKEVNEKQYQAVTAEDKYLRIIAGAGSGKTRVLTFRIAYLIQHDYLFPSQILAITFTNKAAEEIRTRVEKLLDMENATFRISTFHSFCSRILREDIKNLNYPSNFTVLDEEDQKKVLTKVFDELNIKESNIKKRSCIDYIEMRKGSFISPEDDLKHQSGNEHSYLLAKIYAEYEKYLQKHFYLDFTDLIVKTIELFENFPIVLDKWQNKIKHILVDEFQDVDANQYTLVKLLAGKHNKVSVVGDPDQTIYTWRGADINIILNFDKEFSPCKTINLEQNYRSTGEILKVANKLIENNHHRLKKNLFTNDNTGEEISIFYGKNEQEEARYVVDNIISLYDGKTNLYKANAVLYRNNALSAALENELMKRKIKYRIYGGIRFYRRAEIKDSLYYLRLALNLNDDIAFSRCILAPRRGIGETSLKKLQAFATTEGVSNLQLIGENINCLENLGLKKKAIGAISSFYKSICVLHDKIALQPKKVSDILLDYFKCYGYFDELITDEEDERIDNIKVLMKQLADHMKKEDATIEDFLNNASLSDSQDDFEETVDYVKLMTVHTAKGLEFENVFIYGLIDNIFPSARTISEKMDGIEEERRLFYVALTRARKRLFLSTSGGTSYMGSRFPSRFLNEIKETAKKQHFEFKNDNSQEYIELNIRAGSVINHDIFGEGIVIREEDGMIDVVFKDLKVGRKLLMANHPKITLIK